MASWSGRKDNVNWGNLCVGSHMCFRSSGVSTRLLRFDYLKSATRSLPLFPPARGPTQPKKKFQHSLCNRGIFTCCFHSQFEPTNTSSSHFGQLFQWESPSFRFLLPSGTLVPLWNTGDLLVGGRDSSPIYLIVEEQGYSTFPANIIFHKDVYEVYIIIQPERLCLYQSKVNPICSGSPERSTWRSPRFSRSWQNFFFERNSSPKRFWSTSSRLSPLGRSAFVTSPLMRCNNDLHHTPRP